MSVTWYISLNELASRPGAVELSQITQLPGQPPTRPELLEAVLRGEDTASWSPAEVNVALEVVERIGGAVEEAQNLIDGYLRQRGYTLPLVRVPPVLGSWARSVVRYKLHLHRISDERTDPIVRDYRDAMKQMEQMVNGKFSLGAGDTQPPAGGPPMTVGPGRTFSMSTLRDYGK